MLNSLKSINFKKNIIILSIGIPLCSIAATEIVYNVKANDTKDFFDKFYQCISSEKDCMLNVEGDNGIKKNNPQLNHINLIADKNSYITFSKESNTIKMKKILFVNGMKSLYILNDEDSVKGIEENNAELKEKIKKLEEKISEQNKIINTSKIDSKKSSEMAEKIKKDEIVKEVMKKDLYESEISIRPKYDRTFDNIKLRDKSTKYVGTYTIDGNTEDSQPSYEDENVNQIVDYIKQENQKNVSVKKHSENEILENIVKGNFTRETIIKTDEIKFQIIDKDKNILVKKEAPLKIETIEKNNELDSESIKVRESDDKIYFFFKGEKLDKSRFIKLEWISPSGKVDRERSKMIQSGKNSFEDYRFKDGREKGIWTLKVTEESGKVISSTYNLK